MRRRPILTWFTWRNAVETRRERWTVSMQFTFLDEVPAELMVFNPMGIIITYLRGDRALVTGE